MLFDDDFKNCVYEYLYLMEEIVVENNFMYLCIVYVFCEVIVMSLVVRVYVLNMCFLVCQDFNVFKIGMFCFIS